MVFWFKCSTLFQSKIQNFLLAFFSINFYYSSAKAFQKLPLLHFVLYNVCCRDYYIKVGRANAGKTRNRKKSE